LRGEGSEKKGDRDGKTKGQNCRQSGVDVRNLVAGGIKWHLGGHRKREKKDKMGGKGKAVATAIKHLVTKVR